MYCHHFQDSSIDLNNFQNETLFSRNFVTDIKKSSIYVRWQQDRIFAEKKIGKLGICSS